MSSNNTSLPPLPANHLSHPESWATGSDPVTSKQEGFIKVLEGQHPDLAPEGGVDMSKLSKSDASDVIDKLKKGEKLDDSVNDAENHVENGGKPAAASSSETPSKRKEPPTDTSDAPASLEAAQADTEVKEANGQSTSNGATNESGEVKSTPAKASEDEARPAKKAKKEEKVADKGEAAESAEGALAEDPIEVDTPPNDDIATPSEPVDVGSATNGTNGAAKKADEADTTPGDEAHLDHPENWATGDQPATDKQKGFIKVLEQQKGATGVVGDVESLGKSEASVKIDELKKM